MGKHFGSKAEVVIYDNLTWDKDYRVHVLQAGCWSHDQIYPDTYGSSDGRCGWRTTHPERSVLESLAAHHAAEHDRREVQRKSLKLKKRVGLQRAQLARFGV